MTKLISDKYLDQQLKLHANPNYGSMSIKRAPEVAWLYEWLSCRGILDYGAGKRKLYTGLKKAGYEGWYGAYDPAVLEIRDIPTGWEKADFLVCIDVLEHIEPELLDNVLDHMEKYTNNHVFITVATGPAKKVLVDGRNAHLIQKDYEWWKPHLEKRWHIQKVNYEDSGSYKGFKVWCTHKAVPPGYVPIPRGTRLI